MRPDDKTDPNAEEKTLAVMANSLSKAVEQPEEDSNGQPSEDTPVEPEASTENQPT